MLPFWLIAFHAGTPPVISQTVMSVMFVSLGILLIGIGFGYFLVHAIIGVPTITLGLICAFGDLPQKKKLDALGSHFFGRQALHLG
jgi:hypothetical protein